MKFEFTIPEGFHLMTLHATPTRGGINWNAYIRVNRTSGDGPFHGAQDYDLQAAIDRAHAGLLKKIQASAPPPSPKLAGLKLNLSSLGVKS